MAPNHRNIVTLYDKYECGKEYTCTKRGTFTVPYVTDAIQVKRTSPVEGKRVV